MQETWVQSLGQEDPMEKEMATHSSILAWEIPWTEEPGGLQSTGLQSRTWLSDSHTHPVTVFLEKWHEIPALRFDEQRSVQGKPGPFAGQQEF